MMSEELLSILACSKCKGPVVLIFKNKDQKEPSYVECSACRLRYAIRENIPVMILEQAEKF